MDLAVNEGGKGISNLLEGYRKLFLECLSLWQKLDDTGVDELKEFYVVATDLEGHSVAAFIDRVIWFFRSLVVVVPERAIQIMWRF